jgi:hypothetical protein
MISPTLFELVKSIRLNNRHELNQVFQYIQLVVWNEVFIRGCLTVAYDILEVFFFNPNSFLPDLLLIPIGYGGSYDKWSAWPKASNIAERGDEQHFLLLALAV